MYLNSCKIDRVKGIEAFEMSFMDGYQAGWHVVLGNNGSGKSTLLKSIAIAMLGPSTFDTYMLNPATWVRVGSPQARIDIQITSHQGDSWSGQGRTRTNPACNYAVRIQEKGDVGYWHETSSDFENSSGRAMWVKDNAVWFHAGFGPFRRITGGDANKSRIHYLKPKHGRHLSLFGEDVALIEIHDWLKDLHHKALEHKDRAQSGKPFLNLLVDFINESNLLPNQIRIASVSSTGVLFADAQGCSIELDSLSDGYRSVLGLTLEIIRLMTDTNIGYGIDNLFGQENGNVVVTKPGVILVDEIDAHLHPLWQTEIGPWFKRYFPLVQFIVSTHSPLVCQAADTIWKLPDAMNGKRGGQLTGNDFSIAKNGNVLEIYGATTAFGLVKQRSDEGLAQMDANTLQSIQKLDFSLMECIAPPDEAAE